MSHENLIELCFIATLLDDDMNYYIQTAELNEYAGRPTLAELRADPDRHYTCIVSYHIVSLISPS